MENDLRERLLRNEPLDRNAVLSKLCEPFPEEAVRRTEENNEYIPIEYFRERLNDVIGLFNYRDEYEDLDVLTIKDSCVIKVKCTLYLLDDNGQVFLQKSAYGGATVVFPNTDIIDPTDPAKKKKIKATTSSTVPNTIASAEQDAFKRVCRRLGMAEANLAIDKGKKATNMKAEEELIEVTFTSPFNERNGNIYASVKLDNQNYPFACFAKDGALAGYDRSTIANMFQEGNTISGYFIRNLYQGKVQLVLKRLIKP